MPLDEQLGAVDPQEVLNDVIRQRAPDLAGTSGRVDPQFMMDRLIRSHIYGQKRQKTPAMSEPDFDALTGDAQQTGPSVDFDAMTSPVAAQPEQPAPPQQQEPQAKKSWSEAAGDLARAAVHGIPGVGALVQGAEALGTKGLAKYGKAGAQGLTDIAGGGLQAAAIGPAPSTVAAGLNPEQIDEDPLRVMTPEQRQQLSQQPAQPSASTPEQSPIYQAGKAVKKWGRETFPLTRGEQQEVGVRVAKGAPAMAALVGLGLVAPTAAMVGGAAVFGAAGAAETYEDAREKEATPDEAVQAANLSGVMNAALGALPVASVLTPITKLIPGMESTAIRMLVGAAKDGTVFATVGEAQEYLGHQIAKLYNPQFIKNTLEPQKAQAQAAGDTAAVKQIDEQIKEASGYQADANRLIASLLTGAVLGAGHAALQGREAERQPKVEPRDEDETDNNNKKKEETPPPITPPGGTKTETETETETKPQPDTGTAHAEWQAQWDATPPPTPDETAKFAKEKQAYTSKTSKGLYGAMRGFGFTDEHLANANRKDLRDYVRDADILTRHGHSHDEIGRMSPTDMQAALDEAQEHGASFAEEPAAEGTRENPAQAETAEDVRTAASAASQDYSPAQGEANNIQRGHARWNGLDITLEAPAGGMRRGKASAPSDAEIQAAIDRHNQATDRMSRSLYGPDSLPLLLNKVERRKLIEERNAARAELDRLLAAKKAGGTPWEQNFTHDYGYLKGTAGADGDHADVFMGPHPDSPTVFVLDEIDPATGKYRQSKSFLGFHTPEEAVEAYMGASGKTPEHVGGMASYSVEDFKELAKSGGLAKPVAGEYPGEQPKTGTEPETVNGGTPFTAPTAAKPVSEAIPTSESTEKPQKPSLNQIEGEVKPSAPAAALEHHEAIDSALVAVGEKPSEHPPEVLQRAAQLHAQGMNPSEAFQTATVQVAIESGALTEEQARQIYGNQKISDVLRAGQPPERELQAEAPSPAVGGKAAAPAEGQKAEGKPGKVVSGVGKAGEAGPITEVGGGEREAAAAGHPETGTGAVRGSASGERAAEGGGGAKPSVQAEHTAANKPAEGGKVTVADAKLRIIDTLAKLKYPLDGFLPDQMNRAVKLVAEGMDPVAAIERAGIEIEQEEGMVTANDPDFVKPEYINAVQPTATPAQGEVAAHEGAPHAEAEKGKGAEVGGTASSAGAPSGEGRGGGGAAGKSGAAGEAGAEPELPHGEAEVAKAGGGGKPAPEHAAGERPSGERPSAEPTPTGEQPAAAGKPEPEPEHGAGARPERGAERLSVDQATRNLEAARETRRKIKRKLDAIDAKLEEQPKPRNALDKERLDRIREFQERIARSLRKKEAAAMDAVDDAKEALKEAKAAQPAPIRAPTAEPPTAPRPAPSEPPSGEMPDIPPSLVRKPKDKTGWAEIGKNSEGQTIYEDQRGVRSIIENGVRLTEPVQLRPTRSGMKYGVDREAHPEFKLATEQERPNISTEEPPHGLPGAVPPSDARPSAEGVQASEPERGPRAPSIGEGERGGEAAPQPVEGRPEGQERPSEPAGAPGGGGEGAGGAIGLPGHTDHSDPGRTGLSPEGRPAARVTGENHVIEAGTLDEGRSLKIKAQDNVRAIELARLIEAEGRPATQAEQAELARYSGWGGIKGAFPDTDGKFGKGFEAIGDKLKTLLDPTEYTTARRSIQYAHYTSEDVVRAMWKAAEQFGFKGRHQIFEPGMGVGNFAGMMPHDIAKASHYVGLELDHTTARIAKLLYPKWGVRRDDFTRAPLPENTFDLVIGNPPFADVVIKADPKYAKNNFLLHDYFFAKSLDAVRPGGMLMFISSAGTMNKIDPSARQYLADRADLVGAVRLPSTAFAKSAGTEVTTDIIALRKRLPNEAPGDRTWTETVERELPNKEGKPVKGAVNRYFSEHPEMVLGKEGFFDKLYQGRYAVHAPKGFDLAGEMEKAFARMPRDVLSSWEQAYKPEYDFGTSEKKEGTFYIGDDGRLMQMRDRVGHQVQRRGAGVEGGRSAADMERIAGLVPVRDALRAVYAADLIQDAENGTKARQRLNKSYDSFVKQYGPINKAEIQRRRPNSIQAETARAEAREEARYAGLSFNEGSFDPSDMIKAGATTMAVARARKEARAKATEANKPWDEGAFDPEDMPDVIIDKRPNVDPFMDDPESYRLRAIEHYNEATGQAAKSRVFSENVISKPKEPEIKSVNDAVLHVLNQQGRLDVGKIAELIGKSESETIEDLGDRIFRDPGAEHTWVTHDEYLSGNVRKKLALAKAEAERNPEYRRNVEALEAAQPTPLGPAQIHATLGMPWLPEATIRDFGTKELGLESLRVSYVPALAQWFVDGDVESAAASATWGTDRRRAPALISDALNRQTPKIFDTIYEDGKPKQVLNVDATAAAQEKLQAIKERFSGWIWREPDRADQLAALYNEHYNNLVSRKYDGSYLTTPGVSTAWQWRPHQTRVISRIIQSGNTYMAHAVGAGKTSAMIGAGMEMRRLGLVRKPMYTVPNHMLGQFTKEFYEQYPTARIAVADERRFHTDRRKQFIANVANEDLDAVIVTHSAFGMIPISDAFGDKVIQDELDAYREVLSNIPKDHENRVTRSRIEKQIERLEQRLSGRAQKKSDQVFTFEEMGHDFLFVDEAHLFRKLDFSTNMGGVKGIDPQGSQASWDLYVKTLYLDSINPHRSLVLASGTPVTNTMAELYTISRYLQRQELAERGLSKFDAWAGAFGTVKGELEQDAAGGYKTVTRFAEFLNTPELSAMVRQNMDVVTSKQLEQYVVRPKLKGGKRIMNLAEKSPQLEQYQRRLAQRMKNIETRRGPPKPGDDIMLTVINDGRHASIDMRLVYPDMKKDPGSKLSLTVDNVHRIWKETRRQKFYAPKDGAYDLSKPVDVGPATQMVFANLGLSGARGFAVPDYIRAELVRRGVPKAEIAFIYDYKTHAARQKLFNDMNEGKIRVLIGSTQKMATGVNAQRRLIAIHNEDPLWFPSDDEQRIGRGLRQGNLNPEIEVHDYSTRGTYDSTMWGMMARKARFIEAFFNGDPTLRKIEDLGEASQYEQAKAITTNDPRLIKLTELKQELEKAERREGAFSQEQYALRQRRSSARNEAKNMAERIAATKQDITKREDTTGDKFKAKIGDATFTKRAEFADALLVKLDRVATLANVGREPPIGSIGGFHFITYIRKDTVTNAAGEREFKAYPQGLYLRFTGDYERGTKVSSSGVGMTQSLEGHLRGLEDDLDYYKQQEAKAKKFLAESEEQSRAEFTGGEEIERLRQEVQKLQAELSAPAPKQPAATDPASILSLDQLSNFGLTGSEEIPRRVVGLSAPSSPFTAPSVGPVFYSAVERAVTGAKQEKASPNHWLGLIKNTPGVKPEEIAWLGLEDWLRDHKGPVTKQELADYVRANQIEVKEVTKGGPSGFDPDQQRFVNAEPKHAKWQLPGGDNYREMLLTLPAKGQVDIAAINKITEKIAQLEDERDNASPRQRPSIDSMIALLQKKRAELGGGMDAENQGAAFFKSSHWDEPNVLAHVRFNDRVIDGKHTLFIEEAQSDWHQRGRKQGYASNRFALQELSGETYETYPTHEAAEREQRIEADGAHELTLHEIPGTGVPDAPFKTTWPELALKRMVRYASEHGYDQIAWTPGDVQADRYDLSKQAKAIEWLKHGDGTYGIAVVDHSGTTHDIGYGYTPEKLAEVVGKEAADKIVKSTGRKRKIGDEEFEAGTLEGVDLKVGGEGMRGFYDRMLPAAANKLGKKFGAKVELAQIDTAEERETTELSDFAESMGWTPEEAAEHNELAGGTHEDNYALIPTKKTVHTFPITDTMREAAVREGFALFSPRDAETQQILDKNRFSNLLQYHVKGAPRPKFVPDASRPLGEQAQMHVLRRGDETGVEHMVAIGPDGKTFEIQGTERNVFFGEEFTRRLNDPDASLVLHHNHPEPGHGTLSLADLIILARPGVKAVWAHSSQGTINRAEFTDKMRGFLKQVPDLEKRITSFAAFLNKVEEALAKEGLAAVNSGRVSLDEANFAHHQVRNQLLHDAELIDLHHNIDLGDYIARAGMEPLLRRIVTALKRGIFNEIVSHDRTDARLPGALRHRGDLGTSLARPEEISRQYRQGSRNTARGRADQAAEVGPGAGLSAPFNPFRWRGRAREPDEEAVLSRIVPSEHSSRLPKTPREIYTAAFDDLNPLDWAVKQMAMGAKLTTEQNAYKLARLTRGSLGRGEQFLLHSTYDYETLRNNGLPLDKVLDPVKHDLDGFRAYIVAKRSLELEGRGIETGVPLTEARNTVARGVNEFGPVQRELVAYQDRVLEYLQKSGILSVEGVRAMRAANMDYVPFFRLMAGEKDLGHSLGGGLKVRDPVKGIKGSERQIIDPIESIIKNTYLMISLAERNRALRAFEDLAELSPIGKDFMVKVRRKVHPIEITPEEINRHLHGEGIQDEVSDSMTVFRPNAFHPNPDEIAIYRNGKRRIYKVGKEIAEAVNALDRDTLNLVTRLLSVPARTLRAGAVLAPEFIFRNPVRDQFSAIAFSEHGYLPVYDFVRGMGHLFKKGDVYQNWLKGGGANAAMVAIDRDYIGRNILKLEEPSVIRRVAKTVKKPFDLLRALSEVFENGTRLGEFNKAMRQGESPFTGGYSAREVTLDFARMGAQTKSINAVIAFWNAQLQGVDRAARAVKEHPFRTLLKIALSIAVPSILLWMINRDDERYKELPRWEKDYYWHIMTDNWGNVTPEMAAKYPAHYRRQVEGQWQINNGTIWRIPKPFELGVLFGSVPERILDAFFTDVRNPYKGIADSIIKALMPPYMPQIAAPMIEQFANRSTFFDRPIVPGYLKDVSPKYQAQPYTSETAKAIGSLISKISESTSFASPLVIENYIRDWTGGLGMHVIQLTEKGLRAAGVLEPKNDPESTLADMPVIKGFVSRFPSASAASVQDFYDTYAERKTAKTTVSYLKKSGRGELSQDEADRHATLTQEKIHKTLGNQLKTIRNLYADPKMPPRDKRQLIDSIYLQMIDLAKRGNDRFKATEKNFQRSEERAQQLAQ